MISILNIKYLLKYEYFLSTLEFDPNFVTMKSSNSHMCISITKCSAPRGQWTYITIKNRRTKKTLKKRKEKTNLMAFELHPNFVLEATSIIRKNISKDY